MTYIDRMEHATELMRSGRAHIERSEKIGLDVGICRGAEEILASSVELDEATKELTDAMMRELRGGAELSESSDATVLRWARDAIIALRACSATEQYLEDRHASKERLDAIHARVEHTHQRIMAIVVTAMRRGGR